MLGAVYLVTGASGFIGGALCKYLSDSGLPYCAAFRRKAGHGYFAVGDIGAHTDWRPALHGVDVVIHLAGLAHVRDPGSSVYRDMMAVNRDGTRRLAEQAAAIGVKRLVYVSSIKVNGERTGGSPAAPERFRPSDIPRPAGAYAESKWAGEQALVHVAGETGMEHVIVRPPLVYGPGVGANFLRLAALIEKGVPLPFKSLANRRSFVFVENLVSLLISCAQDERAVGETFLVSDGHDLSTRELAERIAGALGVRLRLFSCPVSMLRVIGSMTGRRGDIEKLTASLEVDISHTRGELAWRPFVTVDEGIARTIAEFCP